MSGWISDLGREFVDGLLQLCWVAGNIVSGGLVLQVTQEVGERIGRQTQAKVACSALFCHSAPHCIEWRFADG